MAPNALERDVPPLKTSVAVSFSCRPKRRFKVQQTQKSFSMIVLATPRTVPVSPRGQLDHQSEEELHYPSISPDAALAIDTTVGLPGGGLDRRGSERLLVTCRQTTRCDLCSVAGTHRSHMAKRLHDRASRTARSDQMLGRGISQIDYALAQDDTAGGTIGEIGISCCRAKPQLLRRNKRSAFAASLRSCPACAAGGVAAAAKRNCGHAGRCPQPPRSSNSNPEQSIAG